jgi:hypothetical protein
VLKEDSLDLGRVRPALRGGLDGGYAEFLWRNWRSTFEGGSTKVDDVQVDLSLWAVVGYEPQVE